MPLYDHPDLGEVTRHYYFKGEILELDTGNDLAKVTVPALGYRAGITGFRFTITVSRTLPYVPTALSKAPHWHLKAVIRLWFDTASGPAIGFRFTWSDSRMALLSPAGSEHVIM